MAHGGAQEMMNSACGWVGGWVGGNSRAGGIVMAWEKEISVSSFSMFLVEFGHTYANLTGQIGSLITHL